MVLHHVLQKAKASEIVQAEKWKGKEVLDKVSEFDGLKEKLMFIRGKLRQGITDTNRTIAKIDAFGSGMREAGLMAANTFKTFVVLHHVLQKATHLPLVTYL